MDREWTRAHARIDRFPPTLARMTATRITIEGIEKSFSRAGKRTVAVDRVDLAVEPGEIFFLLGPSGCGKTTLLRMIAGFIEPNNGRILFDSTDVTWAPPNQRQVGMVFQSYALWPHLSVFENVAFGLRVRGVSKSEINARVARALALVQMAEYRDRRPNELSGGQQQRIALARALVVEPRVLLLDEPLSNLDAKLRHELREEIRRVCKSAGTTTVYVTHDQKEALAIADRIAVLRNGKVCQVATPSQLYFEPRDQFVASFVGEINLITASVLSNDGATALLRTEFGDLQSNHVSSRELRPGEPVVLGVRPERVSLAARANSHLGGYVHGALFLGDHQVITLKSDYSSIRMVTSTRITGLAEGHRVGFAIQPEDAMCFVSG
ncbi:MAG: spermidine/putrescine ABC transporter ATP-binding protein [Phycisphaerae bacterium]